MRPAGELIPGDIINSGRVKTVNVVDYVAHIDFDNGDHWAVPCDTVVTVIEAGAL